MESLLVTAGLLLCPVTKHHHLESRHFSVGVESFIHLPKRISGPALVMWRIGRVKRTKRSVAHQSVCFVRRKNAIKRTVNIRDVVGEVRWDVVGHGEL